MTEMVFFKSVMCSMKKEYWEDFKKDMENIPCLECGFNSEHKAEDFEGSWFWFIVIQHDEKRLFWYIYPITTYTNCYEILTKEEILLRCVDFERETKNFDRS